MNARELARAQRAEERELKQRRAYHCAIRCLAMHGARKAIKEKVRAMGVKLSALSASDITMMAELYYRIHAAQLSAEAQRFVDAWPEFVKWRASAKLLTSAQSQNEPRSITSAVHMSGAE